MADWKSVLNADPTDWLLKKDNPSVRYFTLVDLLDMPEDDLDVRQERQTIMEHGVVPQILAKQEEGGTWEKPHRFYTGKYRSTVWQLIILAELAADGSDERVKKACDFILENSQERNTGGFSTRGSPQNSGDPSRVIPCLTGNMVWSLMRLGCQNARVEHGIEWIARYQRFDDAEGEPPTGWPYENHKQCWGRHTCSMGAIKALKALAEIPPDNRSPEVVTTIENGAEYFLRHHVYKRSHNLNRACKPEWRRFGFPRMWHTDALEIMRVLTRLGYNDPRMQEAIDLVISKQDDQGIWNLDDTFNGSFQIDIEVKGQPSKWVTLNALSVLKLLDNHDKR
ncbi:MAG TPA: nitrogen fixation protein NifH [Dehalococcoidia bacterium]|nr:nitrogen fixation protein NifH [Dehalococcoidia bacterium]